MITAERADLLKKACLYGILDTQYAQPAEWLRLAQQWVNGGVQIVQVRAKHSTPEQILAYAQPVAEFLKERGVLFIINDYPQLVPVLGADGCHVGQDDLSVAQARQQAGEGAIVGKSTHSLEQALQAEAEGADYIGVGPVFATQTKPDYVPVGLELVQQVSPRVQVPQFCIGGIKEHHLPQVLEAGGKRVVMVSALIQATDPCDYALRCRLALETCGS